MVVVISSLQQLPDFRSGQTLAGRNQLFVDYQSRGRSPHNTGDLSEIGYFHHLGLLACRIGRTR